MDKEDYKEYQKGKDLSVGNTFRHYETGHQFIIRTINKLDDVVGITQLEEGKEMPGEDQISYDYLKEDYELGKYEVSRSEKNKEVDHLVKIEMAKTFHIENKYPGKIKNITYGGVDGALNKALKEEFQFTLDSDQLKTTHELVKKEKKAKINISLFLLMMFLLAFFVPL